MHPNAHPAIPTCSGSELPVLPYGPEMRAGGRGELLRLRARLKPPFIPGLRTPMLAGLVVAASTSWAATTGFNQTGAGPYDYNTAANWANNTINGLWNTDLTLTAGQTVTFASDTALGTGLSFNYGGNFALTLEAAAAGTQTLTLGGDIGLNTGGGTAANVTLGNAANHLNVDLGGATRTLTVASGRTLFFNDTISDGGLILTGAGTLTLVGGNTFSGGLTVSNGTVNLNSNSIAGAGAAGTGTLTLAGGLIQNTSAGAVAISNNIVAQTGTSSTLRINGQDLNLYGNISGGGNLTGAYTGSGTHQISLNGDNSGFGGTCTVNNSSSIRFRFNSLSAGSSNAAWVLNNNNTDGQSLGFGNGTIYFGSLSGNGQMRQDSANATPVLMVGGLNTDATFAGRILLASSAHAAVTKVGTGAWTLTGANGYDRTTTVENGTLVAGAPGTIPTAIALGDALSVTNPTAMHPQLFNGAAITNSLAITVGTIDPLANPATTFTLGGNTANSSTFAGGIALNQSLVVTQAAGGALTLSGGITNATGTALTVTFNNAGSITNSLASIDNGFAGGTVALLENGPGVLTLSATNTYTGNTTVNNGTLVVNGATASGSPVSVTGSGSVLGGSGSVGGDTAFSSGAGLTPRAGAGIATTLSFGGSLTLSGASATFTVSTSGGTGNDQVVYGSNGSGTLNLSSSDTINIINSGGLDIGADYVLFANAAGGTVNMLTTPTLKTNGVTVTPGPGSYVLTNYPGSASVVLHYVPLSTAPTVNAQTASPASLGHYQTTTVTVNVTPAAGKSVTNLSVIVDGLSGPADPVKLTGPGGNGSGNWSGAFTASGSIPANTYTIGGLVRQNDGSTAGWSLNVTVTNYADVWGGGGGNNNWSTAGNWSAGEAPGTGDAVIMDGATQTSNNLDFNLSAASLTFNYSAASFDITTASSTLTLSGGLTNNSASAQTLDVPVVLSGSQTFDAESGSVTVNRPISGGSLTTAGPNTVTLAGNNTYTGGTTVAAGTLVLAGNNATATGATAVSGFSTLQLQHTNAIAGSALTLNDNSTLILQADTNATFADAGIAGFVPGYTYNFQVNSLNSPAGDGHTLTLLGQSGAGANADTTLNVTSTSGDTLSFGPSAYALSGNSGSAFGGNKNNFNLTGANVILNGLNDAAGHSDVVLVLAGSYGNETLTVNGTVAVDSARTIGATVNSGVLTLNNTVTANTGQPNWGFWVTLNGGTVNLNNSGAINNNNTQAHGNPDFYIYGGNLGNSSGAAVTLSTSPTIGFYGDFTFLGTNDLNLGTGAVTLNSSRVVTVNANTLTIGGSIGDSGAGYSLTAAGAGTLALTASNSYTGGTYVNGGTLALSSALTGTTATGALTVNDACTLQVSAAGASQLTPSTLTLGSGSGATSAFVGLANTSVAPIHATNLVLFGVTTITIRSGALQVGQTYPLIAYDNPESGGGSVVLGSLPPLVGGYLTDNGSVISLTVTSITPEIWSGAVNGTWDTASLDWKTNGLNGSYIEGAQVVFDDTATGTTSITNIPAVVSPFSIIVSNNSKPYSFAGGSIGGSASLTKTGNGTLTLANTNTYTGGTTIGAGTLQLGDGSAKNGAVSGDIADQASLTFANPVDQTYAGVISGTGSLTKTGNGTLTLSGANSFSGTSTIKQGAVSVSTTNNLSTNTVVLGDATAGANAALQLTAPINVANSVTLASGAGARTLSAVGGSTLSGALTLNTSATLIETGSSDSHLSGALTGSGNLLVSNTTPNILWVDGPSSPGWTGAFIIQAGTVRPGTANNPFTANTVLSISSSNGAFFNVGGPNGDLHFAGVNDIPGATGGGFGGGGSAHNVVFGGSGNYTYSGGFNSGPWGLYFDLAGSGKQTLTGTNVYGGWTTINRGTLALSGGGVISNSLGFAIGGGAKLDVSGLSAAFGLNSGQTLMNTSVSSPGNILGNVNLSAGSLALNYANGTPSLNIANGTLAFNANPVTVTVSGTALPGGYYQLIAAGAGGAVAGTLPASVTVNGAGITGTNSALVVTNSSLYLVVTPISSFATNPTNITYSLSGSSLTLSWPADHKGWLAQSNSVNVASPSFWFDIAGSDSGTNLAVTIDPAKPGVFYRLRKP